MSDLSWPPIYSVLKSLFDNGDSLVTVFSPFIKLAGLKAAVSLRRDNETCCIIARWRPQDLVAGVSDLEIYPYLKELGIPLYVNHRIHLKLYVFSSGVAVNSSGNLTASGMFASDSANIETASTVTLDLSDWNQIYQIIDGSILVTDEYYSTLKQALIQYKADNKLDLIEPFKGVPPPIRKPFLISALPATATPTEVADQYFNDKTVRHDEYSRRITHDLLLYKIPKGLSQEDFFGVLKERVRASPFIAKFVAHLQQEKDMSFGAVSSWIHNECQDVPVPYRKDIKLCVQNIYTWLTWSYPDNISWDRPNHSQVIHWKS